jgi:perosamine synthetase
MYTEVINFIRNLYGNKDFIPLHAPVFTGNEKQYVNECIDTTFVSSVGKFVDRFEEMIQDYTGTAKAVACVNGTNALHLALLLSGVKQGEEVLTQSLTFIATCNAIAYSGAEPVFIDVDRDTLGLSPKALRTWLEGNTIIKDTEPVEVSKCQTVEVSKCQTVEVSSISRAKLCINKKTGRRIAACVPMHSFGHPCRIDEIVEICNEYHITVVEDAAESLGSFYKEKHTGTFAPIGILSFNGNKTITTGGGGMLLFRDAELGNLAKHLTTQAKVPHAWEFVHDHIGYNYRLPNINAALGCAQMEQLECFIANKRETAKCYQAYFEKLPEIEFFAEPLHSRSNYWLNVILFKDKQAQQAFLKQSNENGVMTRPAWQLMHSLSMFSHCQYQDLKNTTYIADRLVNIPSSVRM